MMRNQGHCSDKSQSSRLDNHRRPHMQRSYKLYQVDAFAEGVFSGNPAAVVPLESWLPDETLAAIAEENNLSETAFFVPDEPGCYHLRWFTPTSK
jgi:PhzF family phenazine biosynthesis protein